MKVKDVMKRNVLTIPPDISVREGLELLMKHRISGLPVVDKEKRLLGMFTEKDFLRYILPSYLDEVGAFRYEADPKYIKNKLEQIDKIKVSEVMRKEVVTIEEDFTISEVARIILTQKARRLPIISKDGKVVGIIAREDIIRAFLKIT